MEFFQFFLLLGIMLPITITVNIVLVVSFKFGQSSVLPEISKQSLCDLGLTVIIFNHSSIFAFALVSITFRYTQVNQLDTAHSKLGRFPIKQMSNA